MIHRFILLFLCAVRTSSAWSSASSTTSAFTRQIVMTSTREAKVHEIETEEREEPAPTGPTWCPEQQIYIGGVVPDNADLERLLSDNDGHLRIFGYGSLCWNPGQGATLSRAEDGVTQTLGRAVGWKRCWAQRSADHRGTPSFQGLVCTLLTDEEVSAIHRQVEGCSSDDDKVTTSLTEGVIYTVPPKLVDDCLEELDFREKGGYERDVIDVIEDDTGNTVKALLYRGTPANPAFWARALLDLPFAAAVMTVSVGPSGPNKDYLYNLDHFLAKSSASSPAAAAAFEDHTGDSDTMELASMARSLGEKTLFFLFGCGSNQHGQLLLTKAAALVNGDEAHDLKEIVLVVPPEGSDTVEKTALKPLQLYCGGGHSGLLNEDGSLYLWGWNEHGQLGHKKDDASDKRPFRVIDALQDIKVEKAALGHSHTIVVERGSSELYAFGDNCRGQVDGTEGGQHFIAEPTQISIAKEGVKFVDIAAGLFHSAAITSDGELVTFGCRRFGQCVHGGEDHSKVAVGRWSPDDGSRLLRVACGHRHTIVLDEHGRVYTMGNNKYGQLGVKEASKSGTARVVPHLVDGPLGQMGSGCFDIDCGWSHNFALVKNELGEILLFGWGRNDKGQLGTCSYENISEPQILHHGINNGCPIATFCCGSESTMILDTDGRIWGCGWNEHGNLGIGNKEDVCEFTEISGARITAPSPADGRGRIIMAAGGAHVLIMKTE